MGGLCSEIDLKSVRCRTQGQLCGQRIDIVLLLTELIARRAQDPPYARWRTDASQRVIYLRIIY